MRWFLLMPRQSEHQFWSGSVAGDGGGKVTKTDILVF